MIITKTKTIEQNIYHAVITITNLTQAEKDLFIKYGEPLIDLGGSFETYEAPHYYRKIYENSPHKFYNADEAEVDAWLVIVEVRINSAIDVLRNLVDDFTGTTLIPTWTGADILLDLRGTDKISDKITELEERIFSLEGGFVEGEEEIVDPINPLPSP